MKMVVHQAVMVQTEVKAIAVAGQQAQEAAAVVIIMENSFAGMDTRFQDMVASGFGPKVVASKLRGITTSVIV